jgi:putative endonuclease
MKQYYIYIFASRKNGTLYIGVTNNLYRRVQEHKDKKIKGFTQKYNLTKLVYYEIYFDICSALEREKNLKKWKRHWKLKIIENVNPLWEDLDPGSLPAQG